MQKSLSPKAKEFYDFWAKRIDADGLSKSFRNILLQDVVRGNEDEKSAALALLKKCGVKVRYYLVWWKYQFNYADDHIIVAAENEEEAINMYPTMYQKDVLTWTVVEVNARSKVSIVPATNGQDAEAKV
jgi:hypothetical protein